MPNVSMYDPMMDVPGYYSTSGGILLPKSAIVESKSKAIQVASGGYLQFFDMDLELYVRQQIGQSRRKWFIFFEMFKRSVWVRSCVDWVCRNGIALGDDRLVDPKFPSNPEIDDLEAFFEECHPVFPINYLRWQWYQSLQVYGYAYSYIEPDRNGRPLHLWPLDPRVTFPITDQHGTILFHVQVYNNKIIALLNSEVLYMPMPNNNTEASPLSPLETIYDSVSLELNANSYNAALFENDLNLGMVFSSASADKQTIDENDRILKDKYARPENAGRHLILYGDMKLLRDGAMALKDINFADLIHQCRLQACTVLGVPQFILGITEGTTRAAGQIHERATYVSTVRPLRQFQNAMLTKQFIRKAWGAKNIIFKEPIGSMLAHPEQIDAASKVADIGVSTYNEYRQLLGLEEVPNGDYPMMKIPGMGGYIRPDQTAAPGLMDPHFDFDAYVRAHEAEEETNAQMAANGIQPQPGTPYVPPMSWNIPQEDPIAARIIDISRSFGDDGEDYTGWIVERRTPIVPGARGGNVYFTKTGQPRYGAPPKGPQAPLTARDGTPNNNSIVNPKDPPANPRMTPEEKGQLLAARAQVTSLLSSALDQNWTDEQFFSGMKQAGWDTVAGAGNFTSAGDARSAASILSEQYPDNVYTVIGSEGQYQVMYQALSGVQSGSQGPVSLPSFGIKAVNPIKGVDSVPGVSRSLTIVTGDTHASNGNDVGGLPYEQMLAAFLGRRFVA